MIDYIQKHGLYPMRKLRSGISVPHLCEEGHIIMKTPEESKLCAHCWGYSEEDWASALTRTNVTKTLGERVAVEYLGNLYPLSRADVVNGAVPEAGIPKDGWFLYYIRVVLDGTKYYKLGVSQKPLERLKELGPTLLYLEYFDSQEDAVRREKQLLRLYSVVRVDVPRLRRKGATEFFARDVLGYDK